MKNLRLVSFLAVALVIVISQGSGAYAESMGTAFTYIGMLFDEDIPANGQYDFSFGLFDMNDDGTELGNDVNVPDVDVFDGYFTVELDFGSSVFNGDARWLQIGVRPGDQNDPCEFTELSPRQKITPVPYSLYSQQTRGLLVHDGNTLVGLETGGTTTGNNNTFLGYQAGFSNTTGNSNIFIGFEAGYYETGSDKLYIANSRDDVLIYGDFSSSRVGIGKTSPSQELDVAGDAAFSGNVGIGTTSPASKLDVNGKIKITDGTQAEGRVLTSNSSGLASWESLAFGSRASKENNATYFAATDGFVFGNTSNLDDGDICEILSGSESPPTTVIAHIYSAGSITGGNQYPFCIPVKKGDYWMVDDNGSYGSARIWWVPVGE